MFPLLVICANRTKKCRADSTSTLQDIKDEIMSKFEIRQNFHIQYLDKELEEWIDLDSTDELSTEEYTKIKVVLDSTCTGQKDTSYLYEEKSDSAGSSRPETPVSTPPRQSPTPTTMSSQITLCTPSSSKAKDRGSAVDNRKWSLKQWPKLYSVPKNTIPISTVNKLDNGLILTARDRRDILTGIYQDVVSFEGGLYPTGDRYDAIVDAIFREYPDIPANEGLSLANSRDLWRERLKVKFSNSRRRIDGDLPEIVARKKKKVSNEDIQESPKKSSTWGLVNYLPSIPESEDETTMQIHTDWLKREYRKKENVDFGGVDRRMSLTLSKRRRMIIEDNMEISDILIQFPWLTSLKELIKEFLRLGPQLANREVVDQFESSLLKYGPSLESLTKNRKKADLANKIRDRMKDLRGEDDRKYAEKSSALLSIASLFKEDIGKLLKTDAEYQTCDDPCRIAICYEGDILSTSKDSFKMLVEGVVVFKCCGIIEAVLGLMMGIYTFNLVYPKDVSRTLLLLQKVFIGLDDETAADKTMLKVMAQINQGLN